MHSMYSEKWKMMYLLKLSKCEAIDKLALEVVMKDVF
jgi:hypothetical protein